MTDIGRPETSTPTLMRCDACGEVQSTHDALADPSCFEPVAIRCILCGGSLFTPFTGGMYRHPYAEILRAIAEGKQIQCLFPLSGWSTFTTAEEALQMVLNRSSGDARYAGHELRVKPEKVVVINGHEVPEPLRRPPPVNSRYWTPNFVSVSDSAEFVWRGDDMDTRALAGGVVHLSKAAAVQHTQALRSLTAVWS